ncbi:MAG: hydrogenase maturation protease [Coriobacteriia bacterium]
MRYLIGIGTYAALDDSIGLRVAETIAEERLDEAGDGGGAGGAGFRAVELAGGLVDLIGYLGEETEAVLVVDAARMGLAPGEWRFFSAADVETRKELSGLSSHEGDLMKVLAFAETLGRPLPPITVLGIEPEETGGGFGLSASLEARFREYVEAAVEWFR